MKSGNTRLEKPARGSSEHCVVACSRPAGQNCKGAVNFPLVVGLSVFVVAYLFFLWFQFDSDGDAIEEYPADGSRLELPTTKDETGAPTDPGQQDQVPSAKSNSKPEPSTDGRRRQENLADRQSKVNTTTRNTDTTAATPDAHAVSAQISHEEPLGDLAISGRVLTRSGSPVAGIEVTATARILFEQGGRKADPPGAGKRRTISAYDGTYAFEKLVSGEYQLGTESTERYAEALSHVRAGVEFADLIVTVHRGIQVQGVVTSSAGDPLARTRIRANTNDARGVLTNSDGRYAFEVKLLNTVAALVVRASREGFRDRELQLATGQSNAANAYELNIVMEAVSDNELAVFSGTVDGPEGEPVAGQRIQLSSARQGQSYRSTTDENGKFVFGGVEPGNDYMVSINAADAYQDYFQRNIEITKEGGTLNIELEAGVTGKLSGQMVNLFGNPVPNFSLVLQTKQASYYGQRVISDELGQFAVAKVPAGELRLVTKSKPYYSIDGIQLAPSAELNVTLMLDWGHDEIHGRVVDEHGNPLAVPNVSLTWQHELNGLRTTVRRMAAADEHGNFHFTQLGPGSHRLTIHAAGYKAVSVNHDVAIQGSDIVVALEAT